MNEINYEYVVKTAKAQEDLLRFAHFSNLDAWNLGTFLVERVRQMGIDMALSIRKPNGNVVFQYLTDGTTLNNENWMRRKFNTVRLTEGCSLRAWAQAAIKGQSLTDMGLDPLDYALCGGGFPIRMKTGELVAVLIVSNLPHLEDHAFLIAALNEYLGVEAPML